jgi:hypothetical protein
MGEISCRKKGGHVGVGVIVVPTLCLARPAKGQHKPTLCKHPLTGFEDRAWDGNTSNMQNSFMRCSWNVWGPAGESGFSSYVGTLFRSEGFGSGNSTFCLRIQFCFRHACSYLGEYACRIMQQACCVKNKVMLATLLGVILETVRHLGFIVA